MQMDLRQAAQTQVAWGRPAKAAAHAPRPHPCPPTCTAGRMRVSSSSLIMATTCQ